MQKLPLDCNNISLCLQESFEKSPSSYSNGYSSISQCGTRTPNEQFHLIKLFSLQFSLFPSFILTELHEDVPLLSLKPWTDVIPGPKLIGCYMDKPDPAHPAQRKLLCITNLIKANTTGGRDRVLPKGSVILDRNTRSAPRTYTLSPGESSV